jgi:hypothetical protein
LKGQITTEYTFWCATCTNWHQECHASSKAEAITQARKMFWKKRKIGWTCPECNGICKCGYKWEKKGMSPGQQCPKCASVIRNRQT